MNKKYICNKSLIKLVVNIFAFTFIFILSLIFIFTISKITLKTLIIILSSYLSTILLFTFIYILILKKSKNFIIVTDKYLIYKINGEETQIRRSIILNIECIEDVSILKRCIKVTDYYYESYKFSISTVLVKKLEKDLNLEIKYVGNLRNINLRKRFKYWLKDIFNKLMKFKKEILFALFGLFQTIISIILYLKYNSVLLNIFLLFFACIVAIYQANKYYLTYKTWTKVEKIPLLLIMLLTYITIVFVAITLFSIILLKLKFSYDYLFIAVVTAPSFIIVITIILLFLFCLSNA